MSKHKKRSRLQICIILCKKLLKKLMSLLILFMFGKFNEKVACLQLNLWQLYEVRIDVVFNLRYNFYV